MNIVVCKDCKRLTIDARHCIRFKKDNESDIAYRKKNVIRGDDGRTLVPLGDITWCKRVAVRRAKEELLEMRVNEAAKKVSSNVRR